MSLSVAQILKLMSDLFDLCSKYGAIVLSKSVTDRMTNECNGYGFVDFQNQKTPLYVKCPSKLIFFYPR